MAQDLHGRSRYIPNTISFTRSPLRYREGQSPLYEELGQRRIGGYSALFRGRLLPPDKSPAVLREKASRRPYSVGVTVPLGPVAPGDRARVVVQRYCDSGSGYLPLSIAPGVEW